jgi:SAM-dependent methyltransferase
LNLASGSQAHPDWTNVDYFPARVRYNVPVVGPVMRRVYEGRGHYVAPSGARVLIADLRKGVPFPDASFDVVYHSNFLEHLDRPDARRFLLECRRLLRPGGLMRAVVPDLEERSRAYLAALDAVRADNDGAAEAHEFAVADLIDQMVRTTTGGELGPWLNAGWPERRDAPSEGPPDHAGWSFRQRVGTRLIATRDARKTGELHRWMYDRESLARELTAAGFTPPVFRTHKESAFAGWERYRLDERPDGEPLHHACLYAEASAA